MATVGIDVGSTSAKTVVRENGAAVLSFVIPTGWSSVDTAETICGRLRESGYDPQALPCVATGYGRVSVPYADKTVTEITCHGRGALELFHAPDCTVVDIGGQDTKVIRIKNGAVQDFLMNDKCSAGTGRFLEVMAGALGLRPGEMCELAASGGGVTISSMCTVFAESEIISLIGRGTPRKDIAFAVVDSIVQKVASQLSKLPGAAAPFFLTGGLCECPVMTQSLGRRIGSPVSTLPQARYAGALGAACIAEKI